MTGQELYEIRKKWLSRHHKYSMTYWNDFDYKVLENVMWHNKAGKRKGSYNDVIIMFDTETSKKSKFTDKKEIGENHVVAWTLSIRAFDMNIVTLYGHTPSELMTCIKNILDKFNGDETYMYAHNLPYDYWFLRRFFMREFGHPIKQLNVKPHYPISVQFPNGLILKDSLILAQRKLEKWADDLNVEHKKAVGCWDYDKIRNQDDEFSKDELKYIECDTLAGVECIQETLRTLNKSIYSIPYTATGIPRGDVQKLAKDNGFREKFLKMAPSFDQYKKLIELFHGGYTHANRHFIESTINEMMHGIVQAFDFSSSYPFCLLCRKYPMERFTPEDDMTIEEIVEDSDENAYMFLFVAKNIRLKNKKHPMPYLQYSKKQDCINPLTDNGRVLKADYFTIYLNEVDAKIILSQYTWDDAYCTEVEQASKDWLPKWFTDYIYKCYYDNKMYKGVDDVLYSISKAKTNSIYGLCVQHSIREIIEEVYKDYIDDKGVEHKSGDYLIKEYDEETERNEYAKYLKRYTSVLPYFFGVWCTSYACENLHRLGLMCDIWLYSDTDSVYGIGWHYDEVDAYNKECYEILTSRGYKPFKNTKGREFILGKAETEYDDLYKEFRVLGAKRYCGRHVAGKHKDKITITLAGVPKKGAECLNDDIKNFRTGMVFDGITTGKKMHTYFTVDEIYVDEHGNETGDSIDLSSCDYLLSAIDMNDIYAYDIMMQVYDEVSNYD